MLVAKDFRFIVVSFPLCSLGYTFTYGGAIESPSLLLHEHHFGTTGLSGLLRLHWLRPACDLPVNSSASPPLSVQVVTLSIRVLWPNVKTAYCGEWEPHNAQDGDFWGDQEVTEQSMAPM